MLLRGRHDVAGEVEEDVGLETWFVPPNAVMVKSPILPFVTHPVSRHPTKHAPQKIVALDRRMSDGTKVLSDATLSDKRSLACAPKVRRDIANHDCVWALHQACLDFGATRKYKLS